MGGGFGVKFGTYPEDVAVAALAQAAERAAAVDRDARRAHDRTTHGRAQVTDLEAAVDAEGRINGLRMHVLADIGAYPIFTFIPDLTLMMGVGVYFVKNVDLKSTCVFTNTTSVAAYRGAGRPEAAYYLERLVDCIAMELGKPPEDVRRVNFIPPERLPLRGADRAELRQRRVRARAGQEPRGLEVHRAPRRAARADRGRATARSSASAWPATSRCAGSARTRAR